MWGEEKGLDGNGLAVAIIRGNKQGVIVCSEAQAVIAGMVSSVSRPTG